MYSGARTSEVLTVLASQEGDRLTVGDIVAGLRDRSFALLVVLLGLPNCLPMPGIPYMSTVTGVPILILAGQMALGRDEPWLPARIARWGISRARLGRLWIKVRPLVVRLERHLRPRLLHLARVD